MAALAVAVLVGAIACEPDPEYRSGYTQGSKGARMRGERVVTTPDSTPAPSSFGPMEPADPRKLAPEPTP